MKHLKRVLPFIIVAVVIVSVYSFFHISGTEIKNIKKLPNNCSVEVSIRSDKSEEVLEYTLNHNQKEAIKNLLMTNSYTRRLSNTIIGVLPDKTYIIFVHWIDSFTKPIYIRIMGNEYISISGQFGSHYHKINNANFEKELIDILNNE